VLRGAQQIKVALRKGKKKTLRRGTENITGRFTLIRQRESGQKKRARLKNPRIKKHEEKEDSEGYGRRGKKANLQEKNPVCRTESGIGRNTLEPETCNEQEIHTTNRVLRKKKDISLQENPSFKKPP